jgi:hypothetical protein
MRKVFEDKLDINSTEETTNKPELESIELPEIKKINSINPESDLKTDYNFLRNKLRYVIERSEEIIDNAVREIQVNPSARAVESISTILKTINDNSKELLNLHKETNKILKDINKTDEQDNKLTKAFIGSVSDILKHKEKGEK